MVKNLAKYSLCRPDRVKGIRFIREALSKRTGRTMGKRDDPASQEILILQTMKFK